MRIVLQKKFEKHYLKFDLRMRAKIDRALVCFKSDPFDPSLGNHALKGEMLGRRAISVTGNVRIIFEEHNDYVLIIMLDVGTHNQVYS